MRCAQKVPSTMPGSEVETYKIGAIIIMLLNQNHNQRPFITIIEFTSESFLGGRGGGTSVFSLPAPPSSYLGLGPTS